MYIRVYLLVVGDDSQMFSLLLCTFSRFMCKTAINVL